MTYSRRQTIEEKNNRKKAIGFTFLSIGFVLFMFFYGLPLLVKLANLAYDFKKGGEAIEISDNTPPPPPRIDSLPKATKKDTLSIEGSSEAGSTVIIDLDGKTEEVVSDSGGRFSTTVSLTKGDNYLKAYAIDSASNRSPDTATLTIIMDNEPPKIEIVSPHNNAEFYGSGQRLLTITGTTEENTKVQVNDRLAIVSSDGHFSFSTQLSSGTNNFLVKSSDQADNTTEISFQVNFTP